MNYIIPLSYNLDIRELINDYDDSNEIEINNFKLYINKNKLIYKITSEISLEFLLDFLNNYNDLIIKKIYYFLIIKYLIYKQIKALVYTVFEALASSISSLLSALGLRFIDKVIASFFLSFLFVTLYYS